MAGLSYPPVLTADNWNKQKGVPPKSELGPLLTALEKAHDGIDASLLLDVAKLKAADEVFDRIEALEAELGKGVKAAIDASKKVAAEAKKAEGEYKKLKEGAKDATAAAAAVGKAIGSYGKTIEDAFASVIKELKPKLAKLEAEDKKKGEEEEDAADPNVEKDRAKVGKLVDTAMRLARTAPAAKPFKFMIGVKKKELFVFVAKSTSSATAARIKKLMDAGQDHVAIFRGECLFENKAHVFVGINIPTGGFAVRIQKALVEQTGKKFKIKVRRPTGETDEAAGDDDGADDALEQATKQGGKDASQAADVLARHKKLKPLLDDLLIPGAPLADELRAALDVFEDGVRGKKFDDAVKALATLEQKVKEAQVLGQDNTKAKQDFTKRLTDLMPDLKKAMGVGGPAADAVKKKLAQVQQAGQAASHSSAKDAFQLARSQLADLQKNVKAALAPPDEADAAAENKARKTADEAIDKASKDSAKAAADGGKAQLSADWTKAAAAAQKGISDLADKIEKEFSDDPNVGGAVTRLKDLAKGLSDAASKLSSALASSTDKNAARAALGNVAKVVSDDLMKEIDGNELMSTLKVVEPMKKKLVEIGATLK